MTIENLHQHYLKYNSICTDTRAIEKGDIFFALKGDSFNGNQFASEAIDKGAKYAIIDEEAYAVNSSFILVNDVLSTLQELANYHRKHLNLKIIALTGSNGKTTTKELINIVLQNKHKTLATPGNLNNHIGVPLTLLSMDETTEIGIVEMGANHLKEIEFLCNIAQPDYGYITNFGKAHLEGFGNIEGVIKGKTELYDHLKEKGKLIFINTNDHLQIDQLEDYTNNYKFGSSLNEQARIEFIEANPFVCVRFNDHLIKTKLIGNYNYSNISAAIAIGTYFKIPDIDIKNAIEAYTPDNNRSQVIRKGSNTIVMDAYNANPTSMVAALDSFSNLMGENKLVILGDMFELGQDALREHQEIADYAESLDLKAIFLVGENFYKISKKSNKTKLFKTLEELKNSLDPSLFKNCTLLIKGSRGMALERVLELF